MFSLEIHFRKFTPTDEIRQLRAEGFSFAKIALKVSVSDSVIRRICGKLDPAVVEAHRRRQDEIANRIDGEPVSWGEKLRRWTAETGQCGATFIRVLKRCRQAD